MIDMKLIRENPELVKASQRKRNLFPGLVDTILELDASWRTIKRQTDELRSERNKLSSQINELKKHNNDASGLLQKARKIPLQLKEMEDKEKELDSKIKSLLLNMPNIVHESVPIGDASKNKVIKQYGKIPKYSFDLKGHEELLKSLDLVEIEKAADVAGARFYYLKGDLVKLNYAIINFASDLLRKKGFTLIQPPYMLNRNALSGAVTLAAFEEMIYKIQDEDLYLIGTAEHALNAYYMNDVIDSKKLPARFAG